MTGHRNQYIKIYIWKAISILLGFVSLFIVIPYLSSDKTLYGIYSVCTSLTIFFSYADLGFLSSGTKYAAEYYIKGDYQNEVRIVGFTAFFMTIMFMIVDVIIICLGIRPQSLIPELIIGSEQFFIARKLIFLLAAGCPLIIAQRVIQVIYMVRVEEYKFQRIMIFGSLLRIISVFYFFGKGSYNIVGYYFFYQLINLLIIVISLLNIKQYGYRAKDFIKSFKFDKSVFNQEKALSISSLIFMISMVLYNELDQIAISNMFGVEMVSIYAIAFSVMTYMRTYSGLIYSPFIARFNHFTGLGDYEGLVLFTKKIILVFAPVLVVPLLNIALFADAFVMSWVGVEYSSSAGLISWMVMSYAVNFITTPLSSYMTAMEKNKKIITGAILLPLIYWFGIIILMTYVGYKAFAIMKFLAPTLLVWYYWKTIMKDIKNSGHKFINLKELFNSVMPSIIISVGLSFIVRPLMNYSHDINALFLNILIIVITICISLLLSLVFNKDLSKIVLSYFKSV